jgi:hypothetical protein
MKRLFILTFVILFWVFGVEAQVFSRFSIFQQAIIPLYRKPSKKELKLVAPGDDVRGKYAEFLRQTDTGLIKLINDKGCSENVKVVVATDDCLKYTMPGAGSSYSFRAETYRIPRLSDITFTGDSFQAEGVLLHGIFVNVGDVPLEKVSLQTAGMKFLTDFAPEPDFDKAKIVDAQLSVGIKKDNFIYRRALFAVENSTFALRSIAYDGKSLRALKGVIYNEFEFDKRRDVIVVFRIVQKDAAGNVTILWKELQRKDSPIIKRNSPKN